MRKYILTLCLVFSLCGVAGAGIVPPPIDQKAVAITGGTINGTTIGATTTANVGATVVTVGSATATGLTTGDIGLPNSSAIRWRNAANNAYRNLIYLDNSDNLQLGGGGASNNTIIAVSGPGTIGTFSATGLAIVGTVSASSITPATTGGIIGTTLADNANAGSIGEVLTNTGTNVSLTTATPANIASVTLTPGDWDVFGSVAFNGTASTSTSKVRGGLSTVSATLPAQPYYYQHQYGVGGFVSATLPSGAVPMQRINVSSNTTVYLVAEGTFTASTETSTAVIIARRRR